MAFYVYGFAPKLCFAPKVPIFYDFKCKAKIMEKIKYKEFYLFMRGVEYTMKKIIILGIFLVCFLILIMPSVSAVQYITTSEDAEEKPDDINTFPEDIFEWLGNLIKFLVKLFFPVTIWD